jgi:hypothetical protein
MNTKNIFFWTALFVGIACDSISIANFIQKDHQKAISSAPMSNNFNIPPVADSGYFNISMNPNYVPCGAADSCGEVQSFKNDNDFQQFVNKYVSEPS